MTEFNYGRGSGGVAFAVGSDPFGQAFHAHRSANGIALGDIAAHLDEQVDDLAQLRTFGDHSAAERMGQLDGRLDHQAVATVLDDAFDEGAELREIVDLLVEMGCDIAQGYAIGRPMSMESLTKRLATDRKRSAA